MTDDRPKYKKCATFVQRKITRRLQKLSLTFGLKEAAVE
jgi:hypothetical protein